VVAYLLMEIIYKQPRVGGDCVSTDAEWHGCLCVVIARMLNAGCTDAGNNSTFCLIYISHKTLTIIWAIQSKLPASVTKANFLLSVFELYSGSSNKSYQ